MKERVPRRDGKTPVTMACMLVQKVAELKTSYQVRVELESKNDYTKIIYVVGGMIWCPPTAERGHAVTLFMLRPTGLVWRYTRSEERGKALKETNYAVTSWPRVFNPGYARKPFAAVTARR